MHEGVFSFISSPLLPFCLFSLHNIQSQHTVICVFILKAHDKVFSISCQGLSSQSLVDYVIIWFPIEEYTKPCTQRAFSEAGTEATFRPAIGEDQLTGPPAPASLYPAFQTDCILHKLANLYAFKLVLFIFSRFFQRQWCAMSIMEMRLKWI